MNGALGGGMGHGSGEHPGVPAHEGHANCSEVLYRIFEYLDGEMTPDDVHRVAEHLQECGPCLEEHDLDRAMKDVVRRSCAREEAPVELRLHVVQQITTVRLDLEP